MKEIIDIYPLPVLFNSIGRGYLYDLPPKKMLRLSRLRDKIESRKYTLFVPTGGTMAISYKKLFHTLIDRNMTAAELQKKAGSSANISTRLRNNTYISMESIEKICRVLNCKVDDIVEFIPEEGKTEESCHE